jgi:hypothetical protein
MFHLTPLPSTGSGAVVGPGAPDASALDRLRPLLWDAATLDPDDRRAVTSLRSAATRVTADLAANGHLPGHLALDGAEPIVVLQRALAAAWSHVTAAPRQQVPDPAGAEPRRILARRGRS